VPEKMKGFLVQLLQKKQKLKISENRVLIKAFLLHTIALLDIKTFNNLNPFNFLGT
jgi:hypothetical protein